MGIRISEATYLVADQDKAIEFFVDAIGFELRQDQTFDNGWRRVVVGPADGGAGLVLTLAEPGVAVGAQTGSEVAFFLAADDFAAQHARMIAYGVRFRERPRHEAYGTVAVFEDLYGMPWDLIGPLPA